MLWPQTFSSLKNPKNVAKVRKNLQIISNKKKIMTIFAIFDTNANVLVENFVILSQNNLDLDYFDYQKLLFCRHDNIMKSVQCKQLQKSANIRWQLPSKWVSDICKFSGSLLTKFATKCTNSYLQIFANSW